VTFSTGCTISGVSGDGVGTARYLIDSSHANRVVAYDADQCGFGLRRSSLGMIRQFTTALARCGRAFGA